MGQPAEPSSPALLHGRPGAVWPHLQPYTPQHRVAPPVWAGVRDSELTDGLWQQQHTCRHSSASQAVKGR